MSLFELEIDEKSQVGSQFMAKVASEIRRALIAEKKSRKITQQALAEKIGTSRAVINRQVQGLENLSARRIAELLWAIGWEPHFEARKIPAGENQHVATELTRQSVKTSISTTNATVTLKAA
ncbi:cyanate lyase [Bradyrhizobium sp. USDA 3686]|uniref:helix-turn-helix domain-containing protein n=1 Tax=Bradyrhizobium canariense TaxID=255045 RepID=UPI00195EC855|nr:helix-turn-helix transcriptional regulator [Bradyrhizobium canariense]MBM7483298.1 cyanate lyase [Bradyrhizobium canariense]MBW5438578.1 helix-turn-helix transcriptional regulator [Bradyrhizobium canariense]